MNKPLLFLLLLLAFVSASYAQADAEIIEDTYNYKIKGNKLHFSYKTIKQINNRDGDDYAYLVIPYSKGDKVSVGNVWIEDANGNIVRKIKNNEIIDRNYTSNSALYQDEFIKTCELKHNTYPYRVVYSYDISYNRFFQITRLNESYSRLPTQKTTVCVEAPSNYPIKYMQSNIDEPTIKEQDGDTSYCWTYSFDPSSTTREVNETINNTSAPYLNIVPLNFRFGEDGSFDTWNSYGEWINQLNKNSKDLPQSEKDKIDGLVKDAKTDREKASILYKYMQEHTRYINVNIDVGGLQTYPASYVVANKYGDCKALTNYMQSMLNHVDIEAYYTLIYAGDQIRDFDTTFPSQEFNHVILTVPLEGDSTFLECTSKNSPFGYLGTFTQNRTALMITPTESKLIRTPALKLEEVVSVRNIDVDLSKSEVKIEATERGNDYEISNSLVNNRSKSSFEKHLRSSILNGSFDLVEYNVEASKDKPEITLTANCAMHNLYKKYGNNIVINAFPIDMLTYETPDNRTKDVQLDYPEAYTDKITFDMGNYNVKTLPKDVSIISKYGVYAIKYTKEDNKVIQHKIITLNAGNYSIDEYQDFYNFMLAVKANELKNIYIEII